MLENLAPSIPYWLAAGTMMIRILLSILALIVLWEAAILLAALIGLIGNHGVIRRRT